ncbi:RnfABCDGE type electron transport complex subunit D [Patescibacteria group bacterium]|nr:RnfABCDGE type electron transport complex subunit D [Patescibacteria group bacterium]
MALIDSFLNRITMYRLVLYYLVVLLAAAALFGFFGILPRNPAYLAFSTLLILATCWVTNLIFAKSFGATPNIESVYITAFILALIIAPVAPSNGAGVGFLIFASAWAMASKYIFALGKKHLFNPAAFGVALSALVLNQSATWWVAGNLPLLPFVLVGGLLIVRKIRRFDLVFAFSAAALVTTALTGGSDYATSLAQTLLHSSFFFLAFVMLTEPLTMPPGRFSRVVYGAIVGFFFAPNIHFGSFYVTPELALLIGNLFAYIASPKGRFVLTLIEKNEIAANTFEFLFAPDRVFSFRPGQYLEWTLGHAPSDSRGNRRFFTIASAPTEDAVHIGVRVNEPKSSFKQALNTMDVGATISASQLAGDFTLPRNKKKKLAFIAGGIGITPFRSMVQYLVDTKDTRPITLLYSNKTASEIAYKDLFDSAARTIGMKTVYALTNEPNPVPGTYAGFIDRALIVREIPDYRERTFYISGPNGMVEAFKKTLRDMGVSRFNITTDYFPGFV